MVMKTGKRMIIEQVDQEIGFEERLKYPILLSENLTSLIAIPLWFENELWGVLLLVNVKISHYQTILIRLIFKEN